MYYVAYENHKIVEFSFYPRWCTSDGEINDKLGIALFSNFSILPEWTLAADGRLIRRLRDPEHICYPQSVKQLTEEAQQRITKMLDEAKSILPMLKAKFDFHQPGVSYRAFFASTIASWVRVLALLIVYGLCSIADEHRNMVFPEEGSAQPE